MTMTMEGGFLARKRGERGEGEVKRIAERVNAFDDEMERDIASFPEAEDEELKKIREDATKLVEKTRKSLGLKMKEWAQKSSFVKMAAVAGASVGIHAALLSHPMEDGELKRKWGEEGAVIRLQSKEEQAAVQQKVAEREARIDHEALASYKAEMSQKIERGEPVTFEDLYFSLEEKNGVLPEDVAEGREGARKMIDAFSEEVGDELSEGEIKHIVETMYGDPDNYDAGQASISEYFKRYNEGKPPTRNCITADRAGQIVFEGVIAKLPEQERNKFTIGEMAVKQHKIATLTWRDGSEERLFPLEPGQSERTVQPEAGIAKVDASFLKAAAVADKPSHIAAGKGNVPPSPDIEATTNQPFPSGYVVEGPLIASDFVKAEVERKGIQVENRRDDVLELTFDEDPMKHALEVRNEMLNGRILGNASFETRELSSPTPEMVDLFAPEAVRAAQGYVPEHVNVVVGELPGWSVESIKHLLRMPYEEINFSGITNYNLREALGIHDGADQGSQQLPAELFAFANVDIGPAPERTGVFEELSPEQVSTFLAAFPYSTIHLYGEAGSFTIDKGAYHSLQKAHVKAFNLPYLPHVRFESESGTNVLPNSELWKTLNDFASPVILGPEAYFRGIMDHPEYWEYTNVNPALEVADTPVLATYKRMSDKGLMTPHQKEIYDRIDAIIEARTRQ